MFYRLLIIQQYLLNKEKKMTQLSGSIEQQQHFE